MRQCVASSCPQGPVAPPERGPGDGADGSALAIVADTGRLIVEAKVLLKDSHGMAAENAFQLLRQYSRTSDLPMRDVAHRFVRQEWVPSGP